MANVYLNTTFNGLSEFDYPAPVADSFVVEGSLQLPAQVPTAASGPGGGGIGTSSVPGLPLSSQVVVTVKQNSTTIYTGVAGAKGFKTGVNAALNDVIKIILTSSASIDQQPNAVQCTVSIYEGGE